MGGLFSFFFSPKVVNGFYSERRAAYREPIYRTDYSVYREPVAQKREPVAQDIEPICPVCTAVRGKLGKQKMTCLHRDNNRVAIGLTKQQRDKLYFSLKDNQDDPIGLQIVKEQCAQHMPEWGFNILVRVYYIEAGPGCGKSYMIRKLANRESDLILAPFKKLEPDYIQTDIGNCYKKNFNFKTTHKAMKNRGAYRIFVDEFTSMPYEILACVAKVNQASQIYLVGDTKQTKLREPTEGLYIGNYIDLDNVSVHRLNVNFRNPIDTVDLLNELYGYNMEADSKIQRSIEFVHVSKVPELDEVRRMHLSKTSANLRTVNVLNESYWYNIEADGKFQKSRVSKEPKVPEVRRMCFSKASANLRTGDEKNTVRANQGGTTDVTVLYCTEQDFKLPTIEELQIVGLSRHKQKLYIAVDNCVQAKRFQRKVERALKLAGDEDVFKEITLRTQKLSLKENKPCQCIMCLDSKKGTSGATTKIRSQTATNKVKEGSRGTPVLAAPTTLLSRQKQYVNKTNKQQTKTVHNRRSSQLFRSNNGLFT